VPVIEDPLILEVDEYMKDLEKENEYPEISKNYTMISDVFPFNEDFTKYVKFRVLKIANGAVYRGLVDKENEPNTRGVMVYGDGSIYEGDWVKGVKEGEGF